ncbi:5-hydroxytryptamine receptor-like [Tetranychus urticae]|nr:5-hydroxytryptamine receptor-like [Tetranychus urticae]
MTSNLRHANASLAKNDSTRCKEMDSINSINNSPNMECNRNYNTITSHDGTNAVANENTPDSASNSVYNESIQSEEIIRSVDVKLDSGSNKSSLILRSTNPSSGHSKAYCQVASNAGPKESLEAKRERKAAKTLAIITGVFVICWLPFFILALIRPICGDSCSPPKMVQSIFSWLGFTNSTLNPIIYTIFSPEFRTAFQRILLGRQSNSRASCNV